MSERVLAALKVGPSTTELRELDLTIWPAGPEYRATSLVCAIKQLSALSLRARNERGNLVAMYVR